jgi:hypothetical protein
MSVLDRFPHSTAELKRVKTVQFGVLSPDEIVSVFFIHVVVWFFLLKSRNERVCVSACDRGRQNFFLSFSFTFLSFDAKKLERGERWTEKV